VVSRDTLDQDFAAHRQRFLAEQGYAYRILDAEDAGLPDAVADAVADLGPDLQDPDTTD
jgi:DNA excision repair protein ERCC-3